VYACAQAVNENAPPPGAANGGCCFYREKNFQGEIGCASQSFRSSVPIQSFFCTEGYAGNLVQNGQVTAPVLCGDNLPETISPIPVDEIHIFTPCPRFSDCCFYTEENSLGEEFCIPSNRAPQFGKRYKSYTCLEGWKPRLSTGAELPCPAAGVSQNFPADRTVLHENLDSAPCEAPARAESIEGDAFFGWVGDQSNFAVEGDQSNFAVEGDQANFAVENVAQDEPLQVTAETENLAVTEDASAFASAENEAAFATIEETDFVELATEGDAAMAAGESSTLQSGSTSVVSMVCLLVGVISLLLA